MSEVMEQSAPQSGAETDDLAGAIQQVLRESSEPLTLSKVKSQLPARFRAANIEEHLRRQVAANVLFQYPKYRSQQDRFWDRPMPVHLAALVRETLEPAPLSWTELRRKLPAYAQGQAEPILQELLSKGELYVHPRSAGRGGDRFGLKPPDAKDYLRPELQALFVRLMPLGFSQDQLRAATLEMLHEEEWGPLPLPEAKPNSAPESSSAADEAPIGQTTSNPDNVVS